MKKIIITVFLSSCLILGIMAADYTLNNNFVMVKTDTVTQKEVKKYINATGICYEQNKREVRVELPLSVDKVFVDVGDEISKGQKILTLNKESLKNKLEMQSVTVSSIKNDNILAKINNYNTDILSPINGVVTKIYVSDGDMVNINLPVMVISDLENLIIKASVPESIINEIFVDQKVLISGESISQKVEGKVLKIHPVGERNEVTGSQSFITVDVTFKDYNSIRPNTTLNLEFEKPVKKDTIIIPFDSVMFDEENPYVYINNLGYAVKRYVNLGEEYDIDVEVISGIKNGDKLVLNPKYNKIKEGDKLLTI